MCTALNYAPKNHYFGRNLDWMHSYGEDVIITPRDYRIRFKEQESIDRHYAIMGMGIISEEYPLYFDGVNECGLCIAGLNFPDNAVYHKPVADKCNVASYEFIPWVLSQCKTVSDAKILLNDTNITDASFSGEFETAALHWIISDMDSTIVCESVYDGLKVYDNATGVLSNNPPFNEQIENIGKKITEDDTSSVARFINAVRLTQESVACENDSECVSHVLRILTKVGLIKRKSNNKYTIYSACINATNGVYYYKLYESEKLYKTSFSDYDLDDDNLIM